MHTPLPLTVILGNESHPRIRTKQNWNLQMNSLKHYHYLQVDAVFSSQGSRISVVCSVNIQNNTHSIYLAAEMNSRSLMKTDYVHASLLGCTLLFHLVNKY